MANTGLIGLWCLETVKLPLSGIQRKGDGTDLFFEFMPEGKAVAHLHREAYPTGYKVFNHYIIFDRIELVALQLQWKEGLLCLRNYHGVTLIFRKVENELPASQKNEPEGISDDPAEY